MLAAINLHDEACTVANEVRNVRTDRHLSSKTGTVETMSAQSLPDDLFSFREVVS